MTATGLLAEEIDIARLDSDLYMDSVLLIGDEHLDDATSEWKGNKNILKFLCLWSKSKQRYF